MRRPDFQSGLIFNKASLCISQLNDHENRIPEPRFVPYFRIMGFKYTVSSDNLHFLTHTVVDWIDVFTRMELAQVIVDSLNFCIANKGLEVYVWCLMPSHLHMIARTTPGARNNLSDVMRDFKKFTSNKIIETLPEINESRKE
jgi:putative transposase